MKHIIILSIAFFAFGCENESPTTDCKESTRSSVMCTALYDPVCGCNGKTYGNSCEASAVGIATYTKGECK